MRFGGAGDAGVHATQVSVTAALLCRGMSVDEVVETVLGATRRAAGDAGSTWDWKVEELGLRRMCFGWIGKHPELAPALPDKLRVLFEAMLAEGRDPFITYNAAFGGWIVRPRKIASKGQAEPERNGPAPRGRRFKLTPFVPFDLATLPPRKWLYGRHYQRRTVSATVAPGGFGKTSLCMVEAVAMATGRDLLGEQPSERLRVWYHNGEDTIEELNRRLGAICMKYKIPQEELRGWFFMTSGSEMPLRVAKGYSDLKIDNPLIEAIRGEISRNDIDVAILDPLVTLHSVSEIDNSKMDTVIRIFAEIADTLDCAIELAHHTRKLRVGGGSDYEGDDVRGASAIKDAVRAARMLNQMTAKDADAVGVQEHERTACFRVDQVKGNNAPPANAVWRRFVNIELPNGDEVGVVETWEFRPEGRGRGDFGPCVPGSAHSVQFGGSRGKRKPRHQLCPAPLCPRVRSQDSKGE